MFLRGSVLIHIHFQLLEPFPYPNDFKPTEDIEVIVTSTVESNSKTCSRRAIVIQPSDLTPIPRKKKGTLQQTSVQLQRKNKQENISNDDEDDMEPDFDSGASSEKTFIESVQAFKCKLCDFLSLHQDQVENHLKSSHTDEYFNHFANHRWLEIAQKENIPLKCPRCDNSFMSEGSRSFKIHMTDDHKDSEAVADAFFEQENLIRRKKVVKLLAEQREAHQIKETASLNKPMEAYVDGKGQLRVRSVTYEGQKEANEGRPDETAEVIDVSAEKYVSVVKKIGAKDRFYVQDKTILREERPKNLSKCSETKKGRKKGSKSIGLSKLKQLNSNISMTQEVLGELNP